MAKNRALILPAVVVGLVLLVVGIIYIAEPAHALPSFFPGHQAGSTHHHVKHGILAIALAICAFLFAWFQTGPSRPAAA
jgi:hypothetical protein